MRMCIVQLGPLADCFKTVSTKLLFHFCLFVYCYGILSVICEMCRKSVCLMLNEFSHNYCLKHIFCVQCSRE